MQEIQSPNSISHISDYDTLSIFLAGSIELDTAEKWQAAVLDALKGYDIAIFNPRRNDWDNTIKQSIFDARFREQAEWELNAIAAASLVIMYFDPATKSPISLLELGLCAKDKNLIVCCPDGFWRKGNVEVVCRKYNIPLVNTLNDLISRVKLIMYDANIPTVKV